MCHGDRVAHFLGGMITKDTKMDARLRYHEMAWKNASAEMLDEIHAMLRHLTIQKEQSDNV